MNVTKNKGSAKASAISPNILNFAVFMSSCCAEKLLKLEFTYIHKQICSNTASCGESEMEAWWRIFIIKRTIFAPAVQICSPADVKLLIKATRLASLASRLGRFMRHQTTKNKYSQAKPLGRGPRIMDFNQYLERMNTNTKIIWIQYLSSP